MGKRTSRKERKKERKLSVLSVWFRLDSLLQAVWEHLKRAQSLHKNVQFSEGRRQASLASIASGAAYGQPHSLWLLRGRAQVYNRKQRDPLSVLLRCDGWMFFFFSSRLREDASRSPVVLSFLCAAKTTPGIVRGEVTQVTRLT